VQTTDVMTVMTVTGRDACNDNIMHDRADT
jgi:hypothetical protein